MKARGPLNNLEVGYNLRRKGKVKRSQAQSYMEENLERCLKCGTQQGLQGVAVTIGRRTFHLFYLCAKCGDVDIEELLRIIRWYKEEKRKT